MTRYIGVDLAWGEGTASKAAKETGLVCLDPSGEILSAGWARGIDAVVTWLTATVLPGDVIAIDAPLVVSNETGMRECERQVAQRYGRWGVAANSTNLSRSWFGGLTLRNALERAGFTYTSGEAAASGTVTFFECYPDTTLVGAVEFGYDIERPRYKRLNPALADVAAKRAFRAEECDELIRRIVSLAAGSVPLDLASHPVTAALVEEPSPLLDVPYKHREDLLDAALCAWTAALWHQYGLERCQILGDGDIPDADGRVPVIIAPARAEQRFRGVALDHAALDPKPSPIISARDNGLAALTVRELIALSSSITDELKLRGHIRTATSTGGELMERVVADAYGGTLPPPGTKSWDVSLEDGRRIQVKARILPPGDFRHWAFRDFSFDLAVVVHVDRLSLEVLWARELTRDEAQLLAKEHASDGWRIRMTKARGAGVDVTKRLRDAYAALN